MGDLGFLKFSIWSAGRAFATNSAFQDPRFGVRTPVNTLTKVFRQIYCSHGEAAVPGTKIPLQDGVKPASLSNSWQLWVARELAWNSTIALL